MKKELPIPPLADTAEQAIEVLSAWVIDDALHCSFHPKLWQDQPETWGCLLADTLTLVSQALAEQTGSSSAEIARVISEAFLSELDFSVEK